MNLTLNAECIVYVPNGNMAVVTLVNADTPTKTKLKAMKAWDNINSLVLLDQTNEGLVSQDDIKNLWFVDATTLNTTADVMVMRIILRPEIKGISSEIQHDV